MTGEQRRALGYAMLRAHDDFMRSNGLTDSRSEAERVAAVEAFVENRLPFRLDKHPPPVER